MAEAIKILMNTTSCRAIMFMVAFLTSVADAQIQVDRFTVETPHARALALSRNGQFVVGGLDAPWVWSRESGVSCDK